MRACAEAITSGDTKLAKVAHAASGALLEDADASGADVVSLVDRTTKR
jgi:hypothetical protein